MANYARHLSAAVGREVAAFPGAGAAGGMGAALGGVLGATLRPGIEAVLSLAHFDRHLEECDLVVTGEGRLDRQSVAFGKAPAGVALRCRARGVPVVAMTGGLGPGAEDYHALGRTAVFPIVDSPMGLETAMRDAERLFFRRRGPTLSRVAHGRGSAPLTFPGKQTGSAPPAMDQPRANAPMAGAGFAAFRGKFACAWERLFSTSRAGQHKTARRLPRWPERVSPPFTGKLACMEPPHMGIVRASHRRKNSHVRGNAASAHLAPDNTKPLAKRSDGRRGSRLLSQENSHAWNRRTWELSETAIEEKIRMCVGMPLQHISRRTTQNRSQNVPMAGAGLASFHRKTRMHGTAAHGIVRDSHRRKICARTEAPLQHISRRITQNRSQNVPMAGVGPRLLSQENSHAWSRRTWELSEPAIEEKIRMCVGMPLQHISRRTTENRALMPRWPARASPPFAGKPACMEPPHMELSETAIEEKIRMCVGMPLQHISRRITQNRSLMPRWPARTELPGSLLPGRTSPARGMRKRRRAASPQSAAPSSSARKRRLPTALCRAALPRSSCRARRFFPNSGLGAAVPAPAAIRA